MRRLPCSLSGLAIAVAAIGPVLAQMPFHERGPGELLPPPLQGPRAAGDVDADLTTPAFLWAFQRDALLPARVSEPLAEATRGRIAAGLLAATRAVDEELRWQSLWALARIARHDARLATGLHERIAGGALLRADDTLAEVAAVASGLAAHDDAKVLGALAAVATDAKAAERRRAFAYYGLGLAAQQSRAEVVQFRVLAAVERGLLAGTEAPAQVRVAALHALASTRLTVAPGLVGPASAQLEAAWAETADPTPIDFSAHVPIAIAAVMPAADAAAEAWRERFAQAAADAQRSVAVRRSCVLALGALCRPWQDAGSPDAKYGAALRDLSKQSRDLQSRYYAWFSMGRAGGAEHREFLVRGLEGSMLVKPWAAFGLAAAASTSAAADVELAAKVPVSRNPLVAEALDCARRVLLREPPPDAGQDFWQRYGTALPGEGTGEARVSSLLATLADEDAGLAERRLAALALGHLGDSGERHWSAALARAIDYRSGTPVLLALPNGVLRLP